MFVTTLLVISKDNQYGFHQMWGPNPLRCNLSLLGCLYGNALDIMLVDTICGGTKYLVTLKDITVMIFLLYSKPNICTCLAPFGWHVFSTPLGTRYFNLIIVHTRSLNGICFHQHYEKLHPSKPHYLATKTQKKLIYNYCATIYWVL
jgi:hypothetical protein